MNDTIDEAGLVAVGLFALLNLPLACNASLCTIQCIEKNFQSKMTE